MECRMAGICSQQVTRLLILGNPSMATGALRCLREVWYLTVSLWADAYTLFRRYG